MSLKFNTNKTAGDALPAELDRKLRRDRIRALVEPVAAHRGAAAVIMARLMAHTRLVRRGEHHYLAVFDNPHANGSGDLRPDAILELLDRIRTENSRLFSVSRIDEQRR
jgi:hypothetical protein